jgi:hypothetical protein
MNMAKKAEFNATTQTLIIEDVQDPSQDTLDIDIVKNQKLQELMDLYKDIIVQGFTSEATGTPIFFTYSQQDQLNYNKIATTVALDPTNDSIQVGSANGVVTMTRAQFLQFVQDAKNYEMSLYLKRISLENQISNADFNTLNGLVISL